MVRLDKARLDAMFQNPVLRNPVREMIVHSGLWSTWVNFGITAEEAIAGLTHLFS